MQPRVLIICDRAAERDTTRVLVGTMGCQWVLASGIEEALVLLGRERTSATLLELPGTISDPAKLEEGVRELLVRFPGRVIVLTDETPGPLLQPLPAGIRYVQPNTRQLVYEAPALTADIAFERPPNSLRTTLIGQVMRTKDPHMPLNGVTVVLKDRKGPLDVKMTNEAGEFSFEFQDESSLSLEIEVSPNDWVLLISPPLDWAVGGEGQSISEPSPNDPSVTSTNGRVKKKGKWA